MQLSRDYQTKIHTANHWEEQWHGTLQRYPFGPRCLELENWYACFFVRQFDWWRWSEADWLL